MRGCDVLHNPGFSCSSRFRCVCTVFVSTFTAVFVILFHNSLALMLFSLTFACVVLSSLFYLSGGVLYCQTDHSAKKLCSVSPIIWPFFRASVFSPCIEVQYSEVPLLCSIIVTALVFCVWVTTVSLYTSTRNLCLCFCFCPCLSACLLLSCGRTNSTDFAVRLHRSFCMPSSYAFVICLCFPFCSSGLYLVLRWATTVAGVAVSCLLRCFVLLMFFPICSRNRRCVDATLAFNAAQRSCVVLSTFGPWCLYFLSTLAFGLLTFLSFCMFLVCSSASAPVNSVPERNWTFYCL